MAKQDSQMKKLWKEQRQKRVVYRFLKPGVRWAFLAGSVLAMVGFTFLLAEKGPGTSVNRIFLEFFEQGELRIVRKGLFVVSLIHLMFFNLMGTVCANFAVELGEESDPIY